MATHYLVLTSSPEEAILTKALVEAVRASVQEVGIKVARPNTLAYQHAYEIGCDIEPKKEAQILQTARASLKAHPIDVNLVPATQRRKKLLVADMESTIIEQECLDELADVLNLRPKIADITTRAMRGELDFDEALRIRVMLLKGLPEATLQEIYATRVTLMSGAQTLVKTMRKNDAICALVSGGFSFYAEKIAALLEFDHWRANVLTIEDAKLSGTVSDPILGREAKAEFLATWMRELNLTRAETIAVGDGSNDLAMLGAAGFGVAFRAKPMLHDATDIHITHGDLTGLLYLQGYRREEFA